MARFKLPLFLLFMFFGRNASAEGEIGEKGADLRQQFEELRADADRPLTQFESKYEGELDILSAEAREKADLNLVVAVREEKANYKEGTKESPHAALSRLQQIYVEESRRLEEERHRVLVGLVAGYEKSLVELQEELTRADKIDDAVTVRSEIAKVRSLREILRSAPGHDLADGEIELSRMRKGIRCELTPLEDGLLLNWKVKAEEGFALTPVSYSPPFRLTFVAKTDSRNLRMRYGKGRLIFNWDSKPDTLYIQNPKNGRLTEAEGQGGVSPNEWHVFEWIVLSDRMDIWVDGEKRFSMEDDYSKLDGPIKIGQAFGSQVTLRSIVVKRL